MGQYYKPIILNEKNKPVTYASCYDFGSGAKLMEHSWMKNDFVGFIERQLAIQPSKLVWAGDYADAENPKTLTKAEIKALADEKSEYWNSAKIKEEGLTLYSLCETVGQLSHGQDVKNKYDHDFGYGKGSTTERKFLINFDKKEFVDKSKVPSSDDGWRIHPLPLLTCEGNNRGGGDFRGEERDLVGRWSRDKIGVASKKSDIPKDFKEVIFNLTE